jgi:DNA modification methylase
VSKLREAFPVMSDAEFAAAVEGVQKRNHWWPFSADIRRGKQMPDILGEHTYHVEQADCIEHMATLPDACVDFAVFSPPFPSLFAYTDRPDDLGNCHDLRHEAKLHFSFFFRQLARIIKPGRVCVVHCMNIPALARNQEKSTFDFRGLLIRLAQRAGLLYQYDWLVTKNPQAQAIRTHSHRLLFVTLERDRSISCGAFGDYLIKFIAPGDNETPVNSKHEISREDWIEWAEAAWHWECVHETDTLNTAEAKSEQDTKHICPLQLGVICRLVKLYTNPGEIVFSPFAGIGSEGYEAILHERRFYGIELKVEYHAAALVNLERATRQLTRQYQLFQ